MLVDALAHGKPCDKGSKDEAQIHERCQKGHTDAQSSHGEGKKLAAAGVRDSAQQSGNDITRKKYGQHNERNTLAQGKRKNRSHGISFASRNEKGGHEHKEENDKDILKNRHAQCEAGAGTRRYAHVVVELHADGRGTQRTCHCRDCDHRPLKAEIQSRHQPGTEHRDSDLHRATQKRIPSEVFQLAKGELHSENKQEEHDADLRHGSHGLPGLLTCHRLEKSGICDSESAQEIGDKQRLAQLQQDQGRKHHTHQHESQQGKHRRQPRRGQW